MTFTEFTDDGAGHWSGAEKASQLAPAPSTHGGGDRSSFADKAIGDASLSATLDRLAELQVQRKFYIKARNRQVLSLGALVRRYLGWHAGLSEQASADLSKRAAAIVAAGLAGKPMKAADEKVFAAIGGTFTAIGQAIEPLEAARAAVERDMKRTVRALPAYAWVKNVHGLGELGFAVILGEAGDLSAYPKKGHLWKRLGLAPFEGHAYSTWRRQGGLTAEDWVAAGYSPRRRAEIYAVVSEPLFRQQSVVAGPYRAAYDRRRAATAEAHPDWTKAHSHMDALRVMTKLLLRDLWQEWRRAADGLPDRARAHLPSSGNSPAAAECSP